MAARAVGILLLASAGFALRATPGAVEVRQTRRRVAAPPICCICINCKWVDRCKTYHWVETQHEQEHVTAAPDFEPVDPQIQVFIREEPPPPPPRAPTPSPISPAPPPPQSSGAAAVPAAGEAVVAGEMPRDLTTEFDVFACDAFTEDSGRWLRLMPDAGFVPS